MALIIRAVTSPALLVCCPINNFNNDLPCLIPSSLVHLPWEEGFDIPSPFGRGVGVRVIICNAINGTAH